ncbi:MAG: hypothetical protein ACRD0I_05445 [Acidimicrobiales bacterium]
MDRTKDADADRPRAAYVVLGGFLTFAILLGIWIALAGGPDDQDLVAGSGAAAVAVGVGFFVSQKGRALPSLRLADATMLLELPRQVVVETIQVFGAVWRKLTGAEVSGSWSTVEVVTGTEVGGWRAARRDAVLTAIMSATPNSIVVDLDAQAGTALVHRLVGGDAKQNSPLPESFDRPQSSPR